MCPGTYPEPFCLQGCPGQPRLVRPDAALHLTSLGSLFTPGCHLPSSCTHLNRPPAPMLSSLLTWAASGHICPRESESVLQEPQPWPSLGRMGLGLDDLSGPLGPEFYNCTYKSLLLNKMCRTSRVGSMPVGTFRVPPHIRTPRVGRQTHRIQAGLSRALYAEKLQGRQRSWSPVASCAVLPVPGWGGHCRCSEPVPRAVWGTRHTCARVLSLG